MCSFGDGGGGQPQAATAERPEGPSNGSSSSGGGSSAEPTQYQQSKTPVYRDRRGRMSTGRRSTILTGGSGIRSSSPTQKKTALGQ